jgi:glycogen debranching enzyme
VVKVRSCSDLADLALDLGESALAAANRARAQNGIAALERLWSEPDQQYLCLDRVLGKLVGSRSIGGLMPVFAAIPKARAHSIARRIDELAAEVSYILPSHDPADQRFDAKRYWRGPVWLVVNYMISDGLTADGEAAVAARITRSGLKLIEESGFAEYYDPHTGEPLGGGRFTWTAAMVLEFLHLPERLRQHRTHPD